MSRTARLMKLNRTHNLATIYGHSIQFTKGEPVLVPPSVQGPALAIGAEFVDGLPAIEEVVNTGPVEPQDLAERADAVLVAVRAVLDKNDVEDFTAGGIPKEGSVSKILGWRTSSKDVRAALQTHHDQLSEQQNG